MCCRLAHLQPQPFNMIRCHTNDPRHFDRVPAVLPFVANSVVCEPEVLEVVVPGPLISEDGGTGFHVSDDEPFKRFTAPVFDAEEEGLPRLFASLLLVESVEPGQSLCDFVPFVSIFRGTVSLTTSSSPASSTTKR